MPEVQVWFDGVVFVARRAGFPGRVFAATEKEARQRAAVWAWSHDLMPEFIPIIRKKKKGS